MTRIITKELIPVWGARDPNSIQAEEIKAWVRGIASGDGRFTALKRSPKQIAGLWLMLFYTGNPTPRDPQDRVVLDRPREEVRRPLR